MFDYYEIVRIVSCPNPDVVGKEGYVAGKCYEDGGPVEGYGVYIFEFEEVHVFFEAELLSMGRFVDPDETRSGERIRVRNADGKGVIVDNDDE